MHNLSMIEECYKKFTKRLNFWIPEGIYVVDLDLLHRFDLLHFQPISQQKETKVIPGFHILESTEKLTLINDEFIVWIIPERMDYSPITYALIAINQDDREPQLEAAFLASGVYNNSKLVLKVLEKFLIDIQETQILLSKYEKLA